LTSSFKPCILASMVQPSLFPTTRWSVSELTRRVRERLDSDEMLQDVWVAGEISNLSRPASGHMYFTLKDASAALRCVMWKSDVARLRLPFQDGMSIEAHGRVSVYEAGGQYQLYADRIRAVGEGELYQEFLHLKALLEAEGLFDPARKRTIPELPHKIGLVTSATGAALSDMLSTLRRRMPLAEVILAASAVQGVEAPAELVTALQSINRQKPDVILLARGGGSIEDLWAFNDERVVRAVAASEAPVICGVGHETDFTLCDFAADIRAPTPTAAAEFATQITVADLAANLQTARSRLSSAALNLLVAQKTSFSGHLARLRFVTPGRRIQSDRQRLDDYSRRTVSAVGHQIQLQTVQVKSLFKRLESLSPLGVLGRGYALVTRKDDGRLIARVAQASEEMRVRVSDGEFEVRKA
jgi:exodeoxyribonuclease VII large subunit